MQLYAGVDGHLFVYWRSTGINALLLLTKPSQSRRDSVTLDPAHLIDQRPISAPPAVQHRPPVHAVGAIIDLPSGKLRGFIASW